MTDKEKAAAVVEIIEQVESEIGDAQCEARAVDRLAAEDEETDVAEAMSVLDEIGPILDGVLDRLARVRKPLEAIR